MSDGRRIHFYNGGMVRQRLRAGRWATAIDPFVERPEQWEAWGSIWDGLNAWDSLFDRSGAIPHPLRIENLRPVPPIDPTFDESLESLCLHRARQIAAEGQPIRLFWSGGIDSTLVVCSFFMAGVPLDQLELVYTRFSLAEYPSFLQRFAPSGLKTTELQAFPHHAFVPDQRAAEFAELPCLGDHVDPARLNVTGGLGDKLFNSHMMLKAFGYPKALLPYERAVPSPLVEATAALVAACPLPVETTSQFAWWLYFALYYQDELLQMLAGVSGSSLADRRDALRVFFDTEGFQQWSMKHRDRVATDDPARLKRDAKEVIFTFTKDAPYRDHKLKQGSLKFRKTPNVPWDAPILFILEDGAIVRPDDDA